jgi:hypothetical protein
MFWCQVLLFKFVIQVKWSPVPSIFLWSGVSCQHVQVLRMAGLDISSLSFVSNFRLWNTVTLFVAIFLKKVFIPPPSSFLSIACYHVPIFLQSMIQKFNFMPEVCLFLFVSDPMFPPCCLVKSTAFDVYEELTQYCSNTMFVLVCRSTSNIVGNNIIKPWWHGDYSESELDLSFEDLHITDFWIMYRIAAHCRIIFCDISYSLITVVTAVGNGWFISFIKHKSIFYR